MSLQYQHLKPEPEHGAIKLETDSTVQALQTHENLKIIREVAKYHKSLEREEAGDRVCLSGHWPDKLQAALDAMRTIEAIQKIDSEIIIKLQELIISKLYAALDYGCGDTRMHKEAANGKIRPANGTLWVIEKLRDIGLV
jgi:hypothetical protein